MNKTGLIIWREFTSRIGKRSFLLMSILGPLVISLFAVLAIELSDSYKQYKVIVIDPNALSNGSFNDSKWCTYDYSLQDISNADFKASEYDILLFINPKFTINNAVEAFYKEKPNAYARADIIRELEFRLERLKLEINNINEESYSRIKQRVNLKDRMIDGSEMKLRKNAGNVGIVFGVLIFLFIFNFGIQVLRGVIEEKSNRIVEIIISTVSPLQLMTGKIIGIGMVALSQFVIWTFLTAVIMIGIKNQVFPDQFDPTLQTVENSMQNDAAFSQTEHIEINEAATLIYEAINYPGMITYFLFFLIFGFLFYASIFASIGAAVDNDTDSQQFLVPVTLPLLFSFVVAWLAISQPDSSIVYWFSQIPFTSPIVMMVRLPLLDAVEFWQLYLSMGILIFSVAIMFIFSARIYRTGILMYGKKASLRDILRWAFKG